MFTLFFLGAGINCALVAVYLSHFKDTKILHAIYNEYYPPSVVAAVTIILLSESFYHTYQYSLYEIQVFAAVGDMARTGISRTTHISSWGGVQNPLTVMNYP